jgi:hypothetical protein
MPSRSAGAAVFGDGRTVWILEGSFPAMFLRRLGLLDGGPAAPLPILLWLIIEALRRVVPA